MIETKPVSDLSILHCLKDEYGIDGERLSYLSLGADMDAFTYRMDANQLSYFIKLKRGSQHELSIDIINFLYDAGIKQVIPPVKTIDEKSSCLINDFTLIVYPFIDGKDGFNYELSEEQWIVLGKTLKQIHKMILPASLQNHIPKEAYSAKWRDKVRSLFHYLETAPLAHDEIALNLTNFIKKNISTIQRLVNRAEQLCQIVQQRTPELVLCHADIHAGNILIDNKHYLFIVDWDAPMMAPKERDLMFIGAGIANVWNKSHEEELFYKGYGKTEIDNEHLAYYRHERIVEDIALYAEALLLSGPSSMDKKTMYQHFIDMFDRQGVIDMAFKIDEHLN